MSCCDVRVRIAFVMKGCELLQHQLPPITITDLELLDPIQLRAERSICFVSHMEFMSEVGMWFTCLYPCLPAECAHIEQLLVDQEGTETV